MCLFDGTPIGKLINVWIDSKEGTHNEESSSHIDGKETQTVKSFADWSE